MPIMVEEKQNDEMRYKIWTLLGKPRYVITVYERPGDHHHFHILIHGGLGQNELKEIQLALQDAWDRGEPATPPEGVS